MFQELTPFTGEETIIWKRTLGLISEKLTIQQSERVKTPTELSQLISEIMTHLRGPNGADELPGLLDQQDVDALNQMVEVLSLIDEPR